jgi:mono/diheme cytochrome c family protein
MRSTVAVVRPAEYEQWLEEQRAGPAGGEGGEAVFASAGCGGCHALERAGTNAQIGPAVEQVELQAAADAAGAPLDQFVRESIVDPDKVVRANYRRGVMPTTFGDTLTEEQIDALVGYLTGSEG